MQEQRVVNRFCSFLDFHKIEKKFYKFAFAFLTLCQIWTLRENMQNKNNKKV